jgi:cell division protein FtsA
VRVLSNRRYISCLDIGSSKVCALIGEAPKDLGLNILGVGISKSTGIKKGVVIDIDATVESIIEATKQAEQMANQRIKSVYINFPGVNISLIKNRGIVAVSGNNREITTEDIERVMAAAKVIALPSDKEIVDVLPQEFIIDGFTGIKDPIGMVGVRLEVNALIIVSSTSTAQNIVRCVQKAGFEVEGLVLNSLASGQAVITPDEKELGVALVDIGGGTSDLSIFQNGNLSYAYMIPIGGDHITNDIAVGLRVTLNQAEEIKRRHGCASVSIADPNRVIKIKRIGCNEEFEVTQKDIAEIIEPRVNEVFELIDNALVQSGLKEMLPAGLVITGGGLYDLQNATEIGNLIMGLPVRLAIPEYIGVSEPYFSAGVGMLEYALLNRGPNFSSDNNLKVTGLLSKIKNLFKDYF